EGNSGYVSTCGAVSAPGSWLNNIDACGEPLRVNGPIIANHLYLRRTHGSERESRNTPAEVLNLRPDTYLWAQDYFGRSNSVRTDYVRELPPRF
ncbi:hypothetical protein B7Z17_04525, partial [Candidatus Saccharibacteria bacterium 32-49-10]